MPQEANKSAKCVAVAGIFGQTGLEEAKLIFKSKEDVLAFYLVEGDTDVLHGVCVCYRQGIDSPEVGSDSRRSVLFYDEQIACRLRRRGTLDHPNFAGASP